MASAQYNDRYALCSPTLDRALAWLPRRIACLLRKGSRVPYIAHPAHVAILLIKHGFGGSRQSPRSCTTSSKTRT